MEEFIKYFAEQFEDTEFDVFTPNLKFHDLEEWSSLVGLAVLNMIAKKYKTKISPDELKKAVTIQNVWDMMQSKRNEGE